MNSEIMQAAAGLAENMESAAFSLYGDGVRLPDRKAVIGILKDLRKVLFPAFFGEKALMSLPAQDYEARLLENLQAELEHQIALSLPQTEEDARRARAVSLDLIGRLPAIQRLLLKDMDAIFDGDPAAASKEEILFSYPGLYAIFVYRVAHPLYEAHVPLIPRIMSEYAHSRTGIDIHPGAAIGEYFFIDHGTGIVVGETSIIGDRVKLYQGVTLGALSPRHGHNSIPGKRHPTVEDNVTIYSGGTILGGDTVIGKNTVIGGNAFLTRSVSGNTKVVIKAPETIYKSAPANV